MREHEPTPTIELGETTNYGVGVVQKDNSILYLFYKKHSSRSTGSNTGIFT